MIFVDANVPMYLIGAHHPNKLAARRLLERAASDAERLVTSVEVLQEILHRFVAIGRQAAIDAAFDLMDGIVDEVFDVTMAEIEIAKDIVTGQSGVSARDAIHLAVMRRNGIERIMTFDADFDRWPGVTRYAG